MIDRFHEDPDIFIFLISTLAGGTGLNLTGANKVVIFGQRYSSRGRRASVANLVHRPHQIQIGVSQLSSPLRPPRVSDHDLDPAHDLQAMDRAYRFGQTRNVSVYRLLGAGSLEELIYARQLYKQQQMAIGYQASVQTR